jgi:hypothetical protein
MIGTGARLARSHTMNQDRVLAIGLLTRRDLDLLGPTFDRLWPVDEAPAFRDLIAAIDEADRALAEREPEPHVQSRASETVHRH